MKQIIVLLLMLLTPLTLTASVKKEETFEITEKTLQLLGEVNDSTVATVIDAIELSPDKEMTLFIKSPGGSVDSGVKLLESMQRSGKTFTCLIQEASSMAFVVTQLQCDKRYVSEYGTLLQHTWSVGVTPGSIDTAAEVVKSTKHLFDNLRAKEAARLKISVQTLLDKSAAVWITRGDMAVQEGTADKVVTFKCSESIRGKTVERGEFSPMGYTKVKRYVCPFISASPE